MAEPTLSQRMSKAEIKLAEHELSIKDNTKDIARLDASCENFKQFMVETRAEAKQREKSLNRLATIVGIAGFCLPFITAWVTNLINA